MNIKEAEEVIKGLKADCDSGTLDWGYVDGADSVCHSWLVFGQNLLIVLHISSVPLNSVSLIPHQLSASLAAALSVALSAALFAILWSLC